MCKPSCLLAIVMTAAMIALPGGAFAGANTNLPFIDTFETYTNGTPLIDGTNGWYGDSNAIVVQTNTVRTGTNAAMIPDGCTLSNRFQNMAITNIWVQIDLRPILYNESNNPVVDTNVTWLFFVNSNGNFVVHNGPASPDPTNSTNWVVLTNGGVGTSGTNWARIGIYEDFTKTNWDLYQDGVPVTNGIGFVNTTPTTLAGFDVYNGSQTTYLDNVSVKVSHPEVQIAPAQLTNAVVMQGGWTSNSFEVWTEDPGVFNYTLTPNQPWLVLSQTVGSLTGQTADATNTIVVTYTNTAGLTVGEHYGMITVTFTNGWSTKTLAVTLTVRAMPMLGVSPALVTNTVMEGQNLATQVLRVWNGSAYYGIGYHVTTNATWLTVQVTNNYLAPLTTNTLTIQYAVSSVTSAGDVPSNYTGAITVTATNASGSPASGSPVAIPVTVQVNPRPRLALSPTSLSQTVLQGQDAVSQGFDIWNANGFYTLSYTITKNASWLVPTPTSGTSTGQHVRIEVQYSTVNLPAGLTNAVITVVGRAWDGAHEDSAVNATQTIVVALSVTPFATLTTDAQPGYQYTVRKGLTPPDTVFHLWNGGNPPGAMYYTVSPSASWLRATPASGGTSAGDMVEVRVQADATGMKPGVVYSGTVQIDATDAGSGKTAYGSPQMFTIAVVLRNFKGFDFQGGLSGASDLVVYREANGDWSIRNLLSEYATNLVLGGAGYQAVPGDYFGDGVTDLGVYRPASGSWYAWQVGAGSVQAIEIGNWIGTGYVGVPGDYDGDGKVDPGVYQEQSGLWMVLLSGSGYQQVSGMLGGPGYAALQAGDYDGDCKVDPGVYYRASGLWVLLFSSTSYAVASGMFGGTGFLPVPTDYDGDGITDPAIYATETGYWYILPSTTLTSQGYSLWTRQFGGVAMSATLVPAPGDYDGDGYADLGLYDTTTWNWYIITLGGVPVAWGYPQGGLGYLPVLP